MKSLFPGYVPYSDVEVAALWTDCVFSFDANVLLNAYRFSKPTVAKFLEVLGKLTGRVWLTYQAAWEFMNRHDEVAHSQIGLYGSFAAEIGRLADQLKVEKADTRKDALINIESVRADISKSTADLLKQIEKAQDEHAEWLKTDTPLALYCTLFEGCTGTKPSEVDQKKMEEESKARKGKRIPPGFKDDGHGDVLIWLQLIEFAKTKKKPIIYVTDDAKEDWWSKVSGKTIRPHPALTQEMRVEGGVDFYMYPMHRFIEEAGKLNHVEVGGSVIKEIEKVEEPKPHRSRERRRFVVPIATEDEFGEVGYTPDEENEMRRIAVLERVQYGHGAFSRAADQMQRAEEALKRAKDEISFNRFRDAERILRSSSLLGMLASAKKEAERTNSQSASRRVSELEEQLRHMELSSPPFNIDTAWEKVRELEVQAERARLTFEAIRHQYIEAGAIDPTSNSLLSSHGT